tara:strand:+ start:3699 stop:4127 length:429 start_codon:yes stop_codon:yes gene_type:complete
MDTHTQHDPNNPINHISSDEDLQIQRDEKIIDLLDTLADKYIGDTPSEYLSIKTDLTDVNDLFDDLQNNGYFNEEVIYYSSAIRYLKENDPSLTESLEIATEYGYTTENLNSELLASLHASQKKEETFHELIAPELENLFNN